MPDTLLGPAEFLCEIEANLHRFTPAVLSNLVTRSRAWLTVSYPDQNIPDQLIRRQLVLEAECAKN